MTIRQEQLSGITSLDSEATGEINANSARIINVSDPIDDYDVATKFYVDNNGGGGGGSTTIVQNYLNESSSLTMAPQIRNFISGGDNYFYELYDTGMTDTNITTSPAGSDIVASDRGIHITGTLNGSDGKLYSLHFSGLEFGEDFDFANDLTTPKSNACAFVGYSVSGNFFNTWNIASNGVVSNYIYETMHSSGYDSNVDEGSGGENWSGARATYLFKDNNPTTGIAAVTYWTAPIHNKVYAETVFFNGLQSTTFPTSPKAICADKTGFLWVSFSDNELVQYTTGSLDTDYGTLTEIDRINNIPQLIDMVCDGTWIWGITNSPSPGKLIKINIFTREVVEYNAPNPLKPIHSRSRVLFDGISVYVSATDVVYKFELNESSGGLSPVSILSLEPGEVRGLTVDKDNNIYAAVKATSTGSVKIYKYHAKLGGNIPSTEEYSYTWVLGTTYPSAYRPSPFNFINVKKHFGSHKKFSKTIVLEITATAGVHVSEGHGLKAMWKKLFMFNQTGSLTTVYSTNIITPYLDTTATSQGWNLTVAPDGGGNNLIGTITHGTSTKKTVWNINIKLSTDNKELT
jgi:hypothetical protein